MRIGIEAQRIMRKKKHGMDMVALNLLLWLPKVAPQHEFILFTKAGDDINLPTQLKEIKIVYVTGLTYVDWEQVWLPLAIVQEKVDVMHYTGNTASLLCPVPYVLTLHDIIYLESSFSKSKNIYQQLGFLYRKWLVPIIAKRASSVVTVSKYECGKIEKVIRGLRAVSYIYNAIADNYNEASTSQVLLEKLPKSFMFFLGNTDPKKNTNNVIKAYVHYRKKLNGTLPLVVGDFNIARLKESLKQNNASDLFSSIITLGYIPNNDLPTVYRNATCFLYPSLRESFGIPILEAMACGCPVITSETSSMPEIAGKAAKIINPTDITEMAFAMRTIEFSDAERTRLAALGPDQVKSFNWRKSANQYADLFDELMLTTSLRKSISIKSHV